MSEQFKYDAFISYRHIERDKAVAAKLQKMLESYKPPKSVCKDFKQWHVFRDETELPTSSNLSGDIKDALESSRFLIVVCSKETKESRWCMEEIEYFKKLHKGSNNNIITLIDDGEPEEVFPDELCNELIEVKDDKGNISYQSHVVEPLAASVAAPTTKKSLKKLKGEFLRIAAPLLGCGYDTLYNRNQKRHTKRILMIAALVVAFLFAFGLYTSAMLLEINAQKTALQAANDNLKMKTEELDRSNKELQKTNANLELKTKEAQDNLDEANNQRTIAEKNLAEAEKQRKIAEENLEEANRQKKIAEDNLEEVKRQQRIAEENEAKANEQTRVAQTENSQNLTAFSETLWNSGDGIAAIQTVLSALPNDEVERPVVPKAMRVLGNEIGAFQQENFTTVAKLKCDEQVEKIGYAGNGSSVVCQDSTGIYFWNSKTGDLIKKYTNEMLGDVSTTLELHFDNTNTYETLGIHQKNYGTYTRDAKNKYWDIYRKTNANGTVLSSTDVLIKTYDAIYKMNGTSGEILWKADIEDNDMVDITDTKITISRNLYDESNRNIGVEVKIFDKFSGELISEILSDNSDLTTDILGHCIEISNDKAYYIFDKSADSKIVVYNIIDNKLANGKIVYDASKDPLYNDYDNSKFNCVQIIGENLYILKSHWDLYQYTSVMNMIVIDKYGDIKWTYINKNDYIVEDYARIDLFEKERCNNYCDVVAITKGKNVVLLNNENGDHIYTYNLDSAVKTSYCSKGGLLGVLTAGGYEVGVLVADIEEGVHDGISFPMLKFNKFMSQHYLYACFDNSYAVSNINSKEMYLYSNVKNADYNEIFININSGISGILNNQQTHLVIHANDGIYVYETNSKNVYELAKFDGKFKDDLFLSDYLYVVIDQNYTIKIYDIRAKELVFTKECEILEPFAIRGYTRVYALAVDGNLIIQDDNGKYTIINKNFESITWEPEKKGASTEEPKILHTGTFGEHGKVLTTVWYGNEFGMLLEIYDINTNKMLTLDVNLLSESATEIGVVSARWINDKIIAVAFTDNTVRCFDAETGECKNVIKCNTSAILSIVPLLDDSTFGILCNDSILYKFDMVTGEILDSINLNNDDIKILSLDSTVSRVVPKHNCLILTGWESSNRNAYIIDLETFDVIYDVEGYTDYYEKDDRIVVQGFNVIGSYPLYDAKELVKKGQDYISR